jgi:hypothetical protein
MSGKGSGFSSDLLKLIFNGTPISGIAENASTPLTVYYVSLHTASPGVYGNQSTSEATYPGYGRVPVPRDATHWTVSGDVVSPVNPIQFPAATGGYETETFFAVGTDPFPVAGRLLYFGPINPNLGVSEGVTPQLRNVSTITEC